MSGFQKDLERLKRGYTEIQERMKNKPENEQESVFVARYKDFTAEFGGRVTEELFYAAYLNYLNSKIINDGANFIRTTVDYFIDACYGDLEKPRILYHDTLRFRFRWGRLSDTTTDIIALSVGDTNIFNSGVTVDRHLLWTRENWLLFGLGNLDLPNYHYVKLGIFPYELGRGISFGLAYRQQGFLGFSTAFSVDQFAPGILVRFNPIPDTLFLDTYMAIIKNPNDSPESTAEPIRIGQSGCIARGIGQQTYLVAFKAFWKAINRQDSILAIEPYLMYFQQPGEGLRVTFDADTYLTTFGTAIEGRTKKCNWGAEFALNHGATQLPEYDRNFIVFLPNNDGVLQEFYLKVFTQNPADENFDEAFAPVSLVNKEIVEGLSVNSTAQNGKEIGGNTGLYNAFDRFVPQQQFCLDGGFMCIADGTYECIEDVFNFTLGAGYSSGHLDSQPNLNKLTTEQLLNQKTSSFFPVESVYSGERLRHLIILNQGVPRFSVKNPNDPHLKENVNPVITKLDEDFRNLAFVGVRPEVKVPCLKKYNVSIAQNIISYFAPAVPITKCGTEARHYMGTEFTTEITAEFYKQLGFYSYFGVLVPGSYYKDMCGTIWGGQPTGDSLTYLINIGINYNF